MSEISSGIIESIISRFTTGKTGVSQEANLYREQKSVEDITRQGIIPLLISFNEACHRFFTRQEHYPDRILFPQRDATYMGRFWKWLYPQDSSLTKIVPLSRSTLFGATYPTNDQLPFYLSGRLSKEAVSSFLYGASRVAIIDVGHKMTIPYFLRTLEPGLRGVGKDFVPPEMIWALGINVRSPGQILTKGSTTITDRPLPGNFVTHDFATMLGHHSPFISWMDRDGIAHPHSLLSTLEPLLGNTQRPFREVDEQTGRVSRAHFRPAEGELIKYPHLARAVSYVEYFRRVFIPVAKSIHNTIHSETANHPMVKELSHKSDDQLIKDIYRYIQSMDKVVRGREFFKLWHQLEERSGTAWKQLIEGVSQDEEYQIRKYLHDFII